MACRAVTGGAARAQTSLRSRWWPVANFALAIILRQQYVINFLGWLATKPPTSWPLRLRWMVAKWYHFGGLHVGAAIAGTLWYAAFVGSLTHDLGTRPRRCLGRDPRDLVRRPRGLCRHHRHGATPSACGCARQLRIHASILRRGCSAARMHQHRAVRGEPTGRRQPCLRITDRADRLDTRGGYRVCCVAVDAATQGADRRRTTVRACGRDQLVPRRETCDRDDTTDQPYAVRGMASVRQPPAPGGSPATAWSFPALATGPPRSSTIRRNTCGCGESPRSRMANVRKLFTKVVFVATGSGIAPVLRAPPDQGAALATRLGDEGPAGDLRRWPGERAHGGAAGRPHLEHDERGRPDVLRLAYAAYRDSGAEAVICVSNKKITWEVVHGLERRGIPAFGPVWDS